MKLIESKVEYIPQQAGLDGIYKQIELCGRTCYKSEDKITEDSAKGFVDRMIESNHTAMLEHGTVYLRIPIEDKTAYRIDSYISNKYSRAHIGHMEEMCYYITTNLRVLVENNWLEDLQYVCEPTAYHEKRYTIRFTTDRGVSHELVRHRVFSFAQESTRYCNYSKDKFGNELTFIIPSWLPDVKEDSYNWTDYFGDNRCIDRSSPLDDKFISDLICVEKDYLEYIDRGLTPQQARQILPNALKTEICMTGFTTDWAHFFDLRLLGTTGAPHPDMKQLTEKAQKALQDANIWDEIYKRYSLFH